MLARRDMSRTELATRLGAGRRQADALDAIAAGDALAAQEEGPVGARQSSSSPTPAEIDAALDRLAAIGLQSDSRFAENYVRGRQARTGSRRLAAELKQKGVDSDIIGEALAGIGDSDLQRARELWSRRFTASRDPRERARQMRFLAARGFDLAVIRTLMGEVAEGHPPDDVDTD